MYCERLGRTNRVAQGQPTPTLITPNLDTQSFGQARTISPRGKKRTVQLGYKKCGTRALGLSQTLAHGNSKNVIRLRNKRR